MKNKKRDIVMDIRYELLIDYLLFSNDIENDLVTVHNQIISVDFMEVFLEMLKSIKETKDYPESALENAKKVLMYVKNNSRGLEFLVILALKELEQITPGFDKYEMEFTIKKNRLKDYEKDYQIWNIEDFKKSIQFDYVVYLSLFHKDEEYYEFYHKEFLMNQNYIYAIRKLLVIFPSLFCLKRVRKRVLELLYQNITLVEGENLEDIKDYIAKNYSALSKIDFHLEELQTFKEENEEVIREIQHPALSPFNIITFKDYYQKLYIERYLYQGWAISFSSLSIQQIYKVIEENAKHTLLNEEQKKRLLELLNSKRNDLEKENSSLEEYNHYLVMLNGIEINDNVSYYDYFIRTSFMDRFLTFILNDLSFYEEVIDSKQFDLANLDMLLSKEEMFQYITVCDRSFPLSMMRFYKEYPTMFQDDQIYQRAITLLENYEDFYSKKILKKIKKLR